MAGSVFKSNQTSGFPTPFRLSNTVGVPGPPGPPGPAGAGATLGGDLVSTSSTTQKVTGVDGAPINHSTFANKKTLVQNADTGQWDERQLTSDDLAPAFTVSLSITTGGGNHEIGEVVNPTFSRTFAPDSVGITADALSDGTTSVNILGSANPVAAPSTNYTKTTPNQSFTFTETTIRNGVTKTSSVNGGSYLARAWFGTGPDGATSVNLSTGALVGASGTLSSELRTGKAGSCTFSPSANRCYFSSDTLYGTVSFKDANGFTFNMTLVGSFTSSNSHGVSRTYYLYKSVNDLSTVANPVTES